MIYNTITYRWMNKTVHLTVYFTVYASINLGILKVDTSFCLEIALSIHKFIPFRKHMCFVQSYNEFRTRFIGHRYVQRTRIVYAQNQFVRGIILYKSRVPSDKLLPKNQWWSRNLTFQSRGATKRGGVRTSRETNVYWNNNNIYTDNNTGSFIIKYLTYRLKGTLLSRVIYENL